MCGVFFNYAVIKVSLNKISILLAAICTAVRVRSSMPDPRVLSSNDSKPPRSRFYDRIRYDVARNGGLGEKLNERNFSFAEGRIESPSRLIDLPLRESFVRTKRRLERDAFSVLASSTHTHTDGIRGALVPRILRIARRADGILPRWNSTIPRPISQSGQRHRHPSLSLSFLPVIWQCI